MRLTFNWGTGIALVYATFAAATMGFVTFAMGRPVDLVSRDYYQESLRQDARMAAERNARELGDTFRVTPTDGDTLAVSLPMSHVGTAQGTLTLYRPSNAAADSQQPLRLDAEGRQRVDLSGLARGRWLLLVRWTAAGREFYAERAVDLREPQAP